MSQSQFITVKKDKLAQLIILIDNAQILSEKLEDNNQECRIIAHSLVTSARRKNQVKSVDKLLLDYKQSESLNNRKNNKG